MLSHNSNLTHLGLGYISISKSTVDLIASNLKSLVDLQIEGK